MPRSKKAKPTRTIKPGTVYGPYTVGKVVRTELVPVMMRVNTYAVTCRCGRKYERSAATLGLSKKFAGCRKCVDRGDHIASLTAAKTKHDRNAALLADRKMGATGSELAAKYKITPARVYSILKRLGA
jgi:Mor family transcriptional regulator